MVVGRKYVFNKQTPSIEEIVYVLCKNTGLNIQSNKFGVIHPFLKHGGVMFFYTKPNIIETHKGHFVISYLDIAFDDAMIELGALKSGYDNDPNILSKWSGKKWEEVAKDYRDYLSEEAIKALEYDLEDIERDTTPIYK